jgi:phosphoribosylformylglycinamidine (FGAM) synthase-like enzyme
VAVFAQSHQDITGIATSIGEQPIKGLLDPAAMSRLAMGEALTNLCWAAATQLSDIKASVNWMYAAKMKSEGAAMYEAAIALRWVRETGGGRAGPAGHWWGWIMHWSCCGSWAGRVVAC